MLSVGVVSFAMNLKIVAVASESAMLALRGPLEDQSGWKRSVRVYTVPEMRSEVRA